MLVCDWCCVRLRMCVRARMCVDINWNEGMQCVYVLYVDKECKWKVGLTGSECVKKLNEPVYKLAKYLLIVVLYNSELSSVYVMEGRMSGWLKMMDCKPCGKDQSGSALII
jgi:hypothetical protein